MILSTYFFEASEYPFKNKNNSIGIHRVYFEKEYYKNLTSQQAEKEYNPNEVMDTWFKSDYVIDRKEAKAERKRAKEDLQEYWEKEFKYEDINVNDKLIIDPIIEKLIREELNATHPLDIRGNYDENQERIE